MNSPATHSTFFNLHYVINAIKKIFNIVVHAIQKVFIEFRIKPMSRYQSQKLLNNTRNHITPASVTLLILKNSCVNSPNASFCIFMHHPNASGLNTNGEVQKPQKWTPISMGQGLGPTTIISIILVIHTAIQRKIVKNPLIVLFISTSRMFTKWVNMGDFIYYWWSTIFSCRQYPRFAVTLTQTQFYLPHCT